MLDYILLTNRMQFAMSEFKFIQKLEIGKNSVYYGDFDMNSNPRAVVFNSRQTKTPSGTDLWVINTLKAISFALKHDWVVITSLGMNTWELPVWACSANGVRQIIVLPAKDESDRDSIIESVTADFKLDRNNTGWLFFQATEKARSAKTDWPLRDKLAAQAADIILPVSVRTGGNLDTLIRNMRDKKIINECNTRYKTRPPERDYSPDKLHTSIEQAGWNYITHWTRTCYGHWPGENSSSFYEKLAESKGIYPGNALETLKNILLEKLIRGSSRHLRGDLKGVAFSGLSPARLIPLMRWRKRYVRWGFEPYGIAIRRKAAIKAGIQPVIYAKTELYDRLLEADKPYFQNEGEAGAWREENEWRYLGDFDLTSVNIDDLRIITFKSSESEILKSATRAEIVSFT